MLAISLKNKKAAFGSHGSKLIQNKWFKNVTKKSMKSVKRAIWLIFGLFSGPLFSPKQFLKKSYKGTFLAISILFRGNLWKIPQQFGENLEKKMRFWANLGCSWSPWEPRLVIVFFFFCWKISHYDPL